MAKYSDVKSLGPSKLAPFVPGEHPRDRHDRRLSTAVSMLNNLMSWCEKVGLNVKVTNQGHHWRFTNQEWLIEWWPSSAKLVVNRKYSRGIHCHDVHQVKRVIGNLLKVEVISNDAETVDQAS